MIERLEGRLRAKGTSSVQLECGPVCFEVQSPLSTIGTLGPVGGFVALSTHLLWKEDGPQLFGFASEEERMLFRLLIGVQGVGPRIALSVLAHLPPTELVSHLKARDEAASRCVPGIGAKTSARILVELGAKADRLALEMGSAAPPTRISAALEDAISALTALGYPAKEARKAVEEVQPEAEGAPLDEILRRALRSLSASSSRKGR